MKPRKSYNSSKSHPYFCMWDTLRVIYVKFFYKKLVVVRFTYNGMHMLIEALSAGSTQHLSWFQSLPPCDEERCKRWLHHFLYLKTELKGISSVHHVKISILLVEKKKDVEELQHKLYWPECIFENMYLCWVYVDILALGKSSI